MNRCIQYIYRHWYSLTWDDDLQCWIGMPFCPTILDLLEERSP